MPQTDKKYWVRINDPGATSFTKGSIIRWEKFKEEDRRVRERGEKPASVEIIKEPPPGNGNGGNGHGDKGAKLPDTIMEEEGVYRAGDIFKTKKGIVRLTRYGWPERMWLVINEGGKEEKLSVPAMNEKVDSGEWEYQPKETPLPATKQGEPVPDKYRELTPFIDEPLPPDTDYLVPAVVGEEGERKIDAVLRELKNGVEGIQDSERFRLFLTTMSKFHDYSIGNLILIALQKPEATRVAGFNTWKNLERYVKKGERGIAILAPVLPPKPKREGVEEEEEVPLTPVYFKVVHVFDLSQTEGKPLPEYDVPSLTGEANEVLFIRGLALAKAQGLDVSFNPMPAMDPSVKGYYSGKTIWVKPDESKAQQLKTLLHEEAHYYSEGVFRIPRKDAETIAESAAYVVAAHFGFDTGTRSFPYVALWAEDKKVLQANLASIRKVATVMLEGLEKAQETGEKLIPALRPYDPHEFAEYVLRYNRFSDAEVPIYSGLSGKAPLRVPDHVWREVIEGTEGEFVKQGEINVFHIPEKERPSYMYAPPFGGFGKAVIPEWVPPDVKELITTSIGSLREKYKLPSSKEADRTQAQSNRLVELIIKAESGARDVNPQISDPIWDVYKHLYALMTDDEVTQYHRLKKESGAGRLMPQTAPESEIVKMYCQKCGKEVEKPSDFRTPENLRVYMVTGLCQLCQDRERLEKYLKGKGENMPATKKKEFVSGGDRVRLLLGLGGKFRYGHWPEGVWLGDKVIEGTVTEFHPEQPAVRAGGEYFEKLDAWAVVRWDNGADTAIQAEDESKRWERVRGNNPAVIRKNLPNPSPKEEQEFISDSPELIPFTIDDIGYRDKLDNAFETAIARVQRG